MFTLKISTDLELRLLEERHADELFSLVERNRRELRQWLPWLDETKSPQDSKSFILYSLDGFAKGKCLVSGIWFQGKIAGVISFNSVNRANRKASIGYWLGFECQGKGLATQACRAMVDYAFKELQLNRVEIACASENHRSQLIPKRLGLKEEGRARQAEWLYDHFVDHIQYSVLAQEWLS